MKNKFSSLLLLLMVGIVSACQSGLIPCPKNKEARLRKYRASSSAMYAWAERERESTELQRQRQGTPTETRYTAISVEEWDCPKPSSKASGKKYMPKEVKENIRKNMRRVRSGDRNNAADSVANR